MADRITDALRALMTHPMPPGTDYESAVWGAATLGTMLKPASDLPDATEPGDPAAYPGSPGQFAARWNARTEEERADWLNVIVQGLDGLGQLERLKREQQVASILREQRDARDATIARVLAELDRADAKPGPDGQRMVNTVVLRAALSGDT